MCATSTVYTHALTHPPIYPHTHTHTQELKEDNDEELGEMLDDANAAEQAYKAAIAKLHAQFSQIHQKYYQLDKSVSRVSQVCSV
jgi:hypothetical protein